MPPTLLKPGYLIPPKNASKAERERFKTIIPIEHIISFLAARLNIRGKVARPAKRPGDRMLILKSDTGSGKSTALPVALFRAFVSLLQKNIIVTQPRVLTAVDIPTGIVTWADDLRLDKNIGYATENFKRPIREKGVLFSTIGTLLRQLVVWPPERIFARYAIIIIDEVHERDTDTDLCLAMLHYMLQNHWDNPDCPFVILTSATFNEEIFMDFFGVPDQNFMQVAGGTTFPIDTHHPPYTIQSPLEYAKVLLRKIHFGGTADFTAGNLIRDVIVFVPEFGLYGNELEEFCNRINYYLFCASGKGKRGRKGSGAFDTSKLLADVDASLQQQYIHGVFGGADASDNVVTEADDDALSTSSSASASASAQLSPPYMMPIMLGSAKYSSISTDYYKFSTPLHSLLVDIVDPKRSDKVIARVRPSRKIFIATPFAETGLTIDTLKYCIDTGLYLNIEFQPAFGCTMMGIKNVTRSMAIQRRGRVGRKSPGQFYPLYTEKAFKALPENQMSKILISNITEQLLGMLVKDTNCEIAVTTDHDPAGFVINTISTVNAKYKLVHTGETNISALEFIELPSLWALEYAVEHLHILGFIDAQYHVTPLGYYANQIRYISLELKRMIFAGYEHGANVLDLITIACCVNITKRKLFTSEFSLGNLLTPDLAEFIGDDFIQCAVFWSALQSHLTKLYNQRLGTKRTVTSADIRDWCEKNGVVYSELQNLIGLRDEVLTMFFQIGLDPYWNGLGVDKSEYDLRQMLLHHPREGLEEVRKIKKCILAGFKYTLLHKKLDTATTQYEGVYRHIPISVASLRTASPAPQYVCVSGYTLNKKFNSELYEFVADKASFISILDNFLIDDVESLH